ncbi:hypothetical protein J6590_011079 [Homalodisca vitripennis]|nr:hypothetical protein J6590_011079 [Homalodisca vitripennis]
MIQRKERTREERTCPRFEGAPGLLCARSPAGNDNGPGSVSAGRQLYLPIAAHKAVGGAESTDNRAISLVCLSRFSVVAPHTVGNADLRHEQRCCRPPMTSSSTTPSTELLLQQSGLAVSSSTTNVPLTEQQTQIVVTRTILMPV